VQVSIVSFRKGGLAVRCHTWDRDLGGRDIDELLFDHFCKEFQARFKIDVRANAKASFKLRTQCQRLKKVRRAGGRSRGWMSPCYVVVLLLFRLEEAHRRRMLPVGWRYLQPQAVAPALQL
jgi:hypothetical protein